MHPHAAIDSRAVERHSAPGSNRFVFALAFLSLAFFNLSCSEETPPEAPAAVVKEAPPATHLRVHTLSLQNVAFDGQRGIGYADLYGGEVHGGKDATENANLIDFRHQYRGRDIANQRSFENLNTKTRWDRLGLFANVTATESKIGGTLLDESTFDLIDNKDDLLRSFDFQPMLEADSSRHRRTYLSNLEDEPLSAVFAFIDKNGRRGLFKVLKAERAPADTVSEGTLTIKIKIEDRQG